MSILDNEIDLVNNNDVIIRSFIETNYDQNSNQGKDFIGKLQVTSINQSAA